MLNDLIYKSLTIKNPGHKTRVTRGVSRCPIKVSREQFTHCKHVSKLVIFSAKEKNMFSTFSAIVLEAAKERGTYDATTKT